MSLLLVLLALASSAASADVSTASVQCLAQSDGADPFACTVGAFDAGAWTARAAFDAASINTTGWGRLAVEANNNAAWDASAFAQGYIEGYLTWELINLAWVNQPLSPSPKTAAYVNRSLQWVQDNAAAKGASDPAWQTAGGVVLQVLGMYAGYSKGSSGQPALTLQQLIYSSMVTEIGDIENAVNPGSRPDFDRMSEAEYQAAVLANSHCSAIVKMTADFSELYFSHVTWSGYSTMLRVYKSFLTVTASGEPAKGALADIHYSGYFGVIPSLDDFYITSNKIAIMETTNNIFNTSLWNALTPESIPYFIRVTVASRLANTAKEWHDIFYTHNSGTYNNQWMTVDYKLFTPKQTLPDGLLYVSEQIPGGYQGADQTMVLQRGYWNSYNVPFYFDIYNISGYPAQVARRGPASSYQLAPRAPLFRRDAGRVDSLADLQGFMQSNTYGTGDPLAPNPFAAIASRGDLGPSPSPFGAIDAKITSFELISAGASVAIAGPTHHNQPPFAWTGLFANQTAYPHYGQPTTWAFDWVQMASGPLGNAAHVQPKPL